MQHPHDICQRQLRHVVVMIPHTHAGEVMDEMITARNLEFADSAVADIFDGKVIDGYMVK